MLPKPPSPLVMGYPLGQPSRSSPATPGGPLPRTLRSNVSTVCPLPSSGATPAACWLPAMAATRSPAPWPRCPPRRRVHPHSARSSSRLSTHCAGLRCVGYDPGGLRGKPQWRLPVGLLLSSSGGRSLWAPRLRLCVCSFVAVAGCTTSSPRPFRCPYVSRGTKFRASTPPRVARSLLYMGQSVASCAVRGIRRPAHFFEKTQRNLSLTKLAWPRSDGC